MRFTRIVAAALVATAAAGASAGAQFTYNSPAGGQLPATVSAVGGIVADLVGVNGQRVVAQRSPTGLFVGSAPFVSVFDIGTQTGFTAAILSSLGGGLQAAAFRVTLFDGDTRSGDFDFNDNFLRVNGTRVGNFSSVSTIQTNSTGAPIGTGNIANGFGDNILNTGFFYTNDATALSAIFSSMLSSNQIVYGYEDLDAGDQFLDFTQGLGSNLPPDVPPVITPVDVIPEPSTYALLGAGLAGVGALARRRRRTA